MGNTEKEFRKLKFGLALKKFMDRTVESQTKVKSNDFNTNESNNDFGISFRNLETDSGIPHPSIVQIVNGKKNASWTTICALLDGLEISLTKFASVYDKITSDEISIYKGEIDKKKEARENKKVNSKSQSKKSIHEKELKGKGGKKKLK
jgi:transcriptional regulator with XRE-family HTH domain